MVVSSESKIPSFLHFVLLNKNGYRYPDFASALKHALKIRNSMILSSYTHFYVIRNMAN